MLSKKFPNKFNFLHSSGVRDPLKTTNADRRFSFDAQPAMVKTLAIGKDRYAGLRGKAYINARQAENKPVQTYAHLLKKRGPHE